MAGACAALRDHKKDDRVTEQETGSGVPGDRSRLFNMAFKTLSGPAPTKSKCISRHLPLAHQLYHLDFLKFPTSGNLASVGLRWAQESVPF